MRKEVKVIDIFVVLDRQKTKTLKLTALYTINDIPYGAKIK